MSHETQLKKLKDIMAQFVGFTGIKLPDDVIA
ncbi:MAG: L(+)-tartrate dehydratase subunit alpha, partial [Sarcina sp.]|nr:L(+)-tartrate dehydratase subunit alpha [Sarcina sp.]